jgi:8-oxo-dGTP diphosphatase
MIRVIAAIIEKNGKYLLAQRKKGLFLEYKWEFPGGKIEENETPEICLKRELFEEFNIEVEVGDFLVSTIYNYDDFTIELMAFKTGILSGEFELNSHEKIQWVDFFELSSYDLAPADKELLKILHKTRA